MQDFQWSFRIKDVINFEGTSITVYSPTYESAIKKIRSMKLPDLRSYETVEDGLRLESALEMDERFDEGHLPELENKDED